MLTINTTITIDVEFLFLDSRKAIFGFLRIYKTVLYIFVKVESFEYIVLLLQKLCCFCSVII